VKAGDGLGLVYELTGIRLKYYMFGQVFLAVGLKLGSGRMEHLRVMKCFGQNS